MIVSGCCCTSQSPPAESGHSQVAAPKLQRVTCYRAQLAEDLCDRDDGHNAWVKVCGALACKGLPRLAAELRLVKRT